MRTAILGATGLVGRTMLDLLARADWVDDQPLLLASARSAGRKLPFRGTELTVREVEEASFAGRDLALFSAGGRPSRHWAAVARDAGCRVVDNSSAWRQDPAVPLVVPEINGRRLDELPRGGAIVANPNCSTIQIAMAVAPLMEFGLREVHVTTLQAVSGAGSRAVDELVRQQTGEEPAAGIFPRQMAANVLPAIGPEASGGSFEEEAKVGRELRRIMEFNDMRVSCTATRVPVHTGHCAAVRVVCAEPVDPVAAAAALASREGIVVTADPHQYVTPREIVGRTEVFVGRLRPDLDEPRALLMWVVADNLLKGAAWNAVQIAARLAGDGSR